MKKMLLREGDMNVNAGYVIQTNSTNDKIIIFYSETRRAKSCP